MPIYEYQCESCGAELEKLQKISDPVLKDCSECGEPSLKKKISATSFRLKGTGWYETDFKTGAKKHVAEGPSEKSTSSKKKDQTSKSSGGTGGSGGSKVAKSSS